MAKVFLLSLGCPKNLVDSEKLLRKLGDKGIAHSSTAEDSDIIVVNTCGFIEEAKRESIEEILRVAELKKAGEKKKKLLVYGCLAKRFGGELKDEIPEIDRLWGVGDDDEIVRYCEKVAGPGVIRGKESRAGRRILTDKPYAYLKIAEGCDRGCSYCVIPNIRGAFRSREENDIINEAEDLLRCGVRELILVAQDITSYGKEKDGSDLSGLIKKISSLKGDFWIRLLYLYPTAINNSLLEVIAAEEKVCKYIDMPLQHSEDRILRLMARGGGRAYYEKLVRKIRAMIPNVIIRTTFIVGFPQESEEDSKNLAVFVRKMKFDRMGAFVYSKEQDTTASRLKGQIPKSVKKSRYERLMEIQSAVSLSKNKALVGHTFKALVDEVENDVAIARLYSQAPEIDGVVIIEQEEIEKGTFVNVRITKPFDYDLKGVLVK
ncbi:MAG TPA: 30S ribosomal protein S12 methylthiotransferase RimO [Candidatus Sulfobium mesophilum]|nr:30S ribosomal protein S12 methylthiotransferase RimO [Candidatus Sulfobium mesophilum]